MSFAATAAAAISAGSAIYMGAQQKKRAKAVRENAQDPGITPNYALDRVSNTLFQNYSNWNLPGYNRYVQQIGSNMASSNNMASIAATSSADILNSVTANQVAADEALGAITLQNASGREQALMRYLSSVQQQGQDQLRMNQERTLRFNQQMAEAAALEGAGIQNQNQGFQDALVGVSSLATNFLPRQSVDQTTGQYIKLPSVWESYRNRRRPNRNTMLDASLNLGGVIA